MRHAASITAVFLVFGLGGVATPPASAAFDKLEQKCRFAIAKDFSKLVKTTDKTIARCHKLRNKGKLDALVDCNDVAQADDKDKVLKARDKLRQSIQKKCVDKGVDADVLREFVSCPDPCGSEVPIGDPIASYGELADCLACLAPTLVESRSVAVLGAPDPGLITKDEARCHQTIGKGYAKHLTTIFKEGLKCQKAADKAGVNDLDDSGCFGADPKSKIGKALSKAEEQLDKKCAAADLSRVGSCSDVDVADLKACLALENDVAAQEMFPAHYELEPAICPVSLTSFVRAGTGLSGQTGSFLDVGWTGLAHDVDVVDAFTITADVACPATPPCGECPLTGISSDDPQFTAFARCRNDLSVSCTNLFQADPACGGSDCVYTLGPPLPISAGNTPTCSLNVLAADVSGTADIETGAARIEIVLATLVHTGESLTRPCPVCVGDAAAKDGVRDGSCAGGARDGLPCDAQGFDGTFAPAPASGLSLDCPPSPATNISGSGLNVALDLTTGVSVLASEDACDSPLSGLDCACGVCSGDTTLTCRADADCAGQGLGACDKANGRSRQPNECSDLTCSDVGGGVGECAAGPQDSFCDGMVRANGAGFLACQSSADCDAIDSVCPGSNCGDCMIASTRSCFLDPIEAQGVADPDDPLLVSTFCIGPTSSAAINNVGGLPGPARVAIDTAVTHNF